MIDILAAVALPQYQKAVWKSPHGGDGDVYPHYAASHYALKPFVGPDVDIHKGQDGGDVVCHIPEDPEWCARFEAFYKTH